MELIKRNISILGFSIYPVLFMFSKNMGEVELVDCAFAFIVISLLCLLFCLLLNKIVKDNGKATVIVSLFLIFFFSYNHFRSLLEHIIIFGRPLSLQRFFFPLWFCSFISIIILAIKIKNFVVNKTIRVFLNVVAIVVVVFPCIEILHKTIFASKITELKTHSKIFNLIPSDQNKYHDLPDIYYIILDSYANENVLSEFYNFDNKPFLNRMEKSGFYIASKSHSNYGFTPLSLSSTLNLSYLDTLQSIVGNVSNGKELYALIKDNLLKNVLLSIGYNCFEINEHEHTPQNASINFLFILLETTVFSSAINEYRSFQHWKNVKIQFESLEKMPLKDHGRPKFVFSHILCPHDPFVFNANGTMTGPPHILADFLPLKTLYINQLVYVNQRIESLVNKIISSSQSVPIIIIQSDHGPWVATNWDKSRNFFKERFGILNMYYVPDSIRMQLYDTITPVNTFRIILSNILNSKLDLLSDRSYWAESYGGKFSYDFIDITSQIEFE